jgi:hypothetical protein
MLKRKEKQQRQREGNGAIVDIYNLTKGMMPFNYGNATFGYLKQYVSLKH